jgi:hypothetical protein
MPGPGKALSVICLVALGALAAGGVGRARGGVIAAGASAFNLDINLTITQSPFRPRTIGIGPVNFVAASGPAGAASRSVIKLSIPPFFSVDHLTSTGNTTFVPLGPGNATG